MIKSEKFIDVKLAFDFGLSALNQLHALGAQGLDPTLGFFLDMVCGPLLYLYYRASTDTRWALRWYHWLGLVVVGVFTAGHVLYRLGHPGPLPLELDLLLGYLIFAWFILFQVFFLVRTVVQLWRKATPVTRFMLFNLCFATAWSFYGLVAMLLLTTPYYRTIVLFGSFLFLGMILFYPLKVGSTKLPDLSQQKEPNPAPLLGVDLPRVLQKLEEVMRVNKLFRDKDLTLARLAQTIRLTTRQLSALLNQVLGVNYTQYVNAWRLDEAKNLLLTSPEKTVLEIAFLSVPRE